VLAGGDALSDKTLKRVVLKAGREKSAARRHPWVFSGAVDRVEGGAPASGETVTVCAADGEPLAVGAYSPQSQIVVRAWDFDAATPIGPEFFRGRLKQALEMRRALGGGADLTGRLVNAESDGLPGLVVDRYGDYVVCQFLSAGAERWKKEIVSRLAELTPARGIYERSDVDVREKEGLAPVSGVLAGEAPPELLEIDENGCRFWVDVVRGHKTGFYLDQRENRTIVGRLSAGREVLNCFAYTGGFGIYALRGGAGRVTNVEASAAALGLAQRNAELNGLDLSRLENVEGDVFQVLRRYRDARGQFDLIVLDPPKFAESHSQVERATRGYKDINLLALKLLRPGGLLAAFSCSGLITPDLFQKIVAGAALDAGREAQILRRLSQSPDHPVALNFPEGEYLKGLIVRVS
jgi:23S rRNA (cytosine1962-C5)-methyltransferase